MLRAKPADRNGLIGLEGITCHPLIRRWVGGSEMAVGAIPKIYLKKTSITRPEGFEIFKTHIQHGLNKYDSIFRYTCSTHDLHIYLHLNLYTYRKPWKDRTLSLVLTWISYIAVVCVAFQGLPYWEYTYPIDIDICILNIYIYNMHIDFLWPYICIDILIYIYIGRFNYL